MGYQRSGGSRRTIISALLGAALAAAIGLSPPAAAQDASAALPAPGNTAAPEPGTPFSFDLLTERMREAAALPYTPPERVQGRFSELDYDAYNRIRFERDRMRWSEDESGRFRLNAFHVGWLFEEPVQLYEVSGGMARPMEFSTADFDYGAGAAPEDGMLPGVAGFRLLTPLNSADRFDELVAFLGASYFRALGRDNRYGISARGLAVNTAMSGSEEFPLFSDFWLERPEPGETGVTLHAALRSASVTGAYRFEMVPGETTVMDVTARLFFRNDIEQLGIAPLTSMFLFGPSDPGGFFDYRPAVHDSDGLVLNLRSGETFFRPLANQTQLANSYLGAENPRSFGLVQRERDFDAYLDGGAHYELRPSLMVEPLGDWGRGTVRLLEIPSELEIHDNIVAFWIPETPARAGESLELSYRLHWGMSPPGDGSPDRARVLRTLVGKGGVSGVPGDTGGQKFVVDFAGGLLTELAPDADIRPVVTVQRGELTEAVLSRIDGTNVWRLVAEVRGEAGRSVELSARIEGYDQVLTETWLYQWVVE